MVGPPYQSSSKCYIFSPAFGGRARRNLHPKRIEHHAPENDWLPRALNLGAWSCLLCAFGGASVCGYHLTKMIPMGGESRRDYTIVDRFPLLVKSEYGHDLRSEDPKDHRCRRCGRPKPGLNFLRRCMKTRTGLQRQDQQPTATRAADGKVVGTIPMGGKPVLAAGAGEIHVSVSIEDKSGILQIDTQKFTILSGLRPVRSPRDWRWTRRTGVFSRCATIRRWLS
jgi:hypothetical protein